MNERQPLASIATDAFVAASTDQPDATEAHSSSDATPRTFPVIAGYEVLRVLGRGGMGVVYLARQTQLNRLAAVKMVRTERTDSKELIRFLAEAEAVAAVKHPHVIQVYEYGDADGRPFLAMEYLGGGSLIERLKSGGRFDPTVAAKLVATLADAVHAAHEQGIVHRDLKPGNVLYSEDGEPKVTDFGLAKRGNSDLTATQAVMGTPAYMAPEQARGDTKFVGPEADVYSLGVILYECLTGTRPFDAPNPVSMLRMVVEQEPERLHVRVPGLSRDVELICLKCLAKEPAERYPTARALAADLARFAAGEPVSVRAAGVVERGYKWARRNPTRAAAYGLTATVMVLLAFGASLAGLWRSAERARDLAESAQGRAEDATKAAELARDGEKAARGEAEREREKFARYEYGKAMQVAHQEWRENNLATTLELLAGTRSEFRGWEWHYVHRLCHANPITFKGHKRAVFSATFNRDGSRVLTASGDETIKVWDALTGKELLSIADNADNINASAFSWDDSRIATGSEDNTAKLWDAKSGASLLTFKGHTGGITSVAFSRDGSRLVTGSRDGTAKVWDVKTGAVLLTFMGHADGVQSVAFHSDGLHVLTGSSDTTAQLWDAKTGAVIRTFKGHQQIVSKVSFSVDESRIVTASYDGTARIWDAAVGTTLRTLRGHTDSVMSAAFSPDGSFVVTGSFDHTAKVWDAKTGIELRTLKGHTDTVYSVTFHPDPAAKGLVLTGSADLTARIWDSKIEPEFIALKGQTGVVHAVSFHPEGSRIVTANGRIASVCDVRTGGLIRALNGHDSQVLAATYSRQGDRIVTASVDKTAKVWNAESGAAITTLKGHTDIVHAAAFSVDSAMLRRVVTGSSDLTARIWDAETGRELVVLKGHGQTVFGAAFSPNGLCVVTGSGDRTAKVWDAKTGEVLLTFNGHVSAVRSVAFSADGSKVLTGGADGYAKVWDVETGVVVLSLEGHNRAITSAAFSHDGTRIVTASTDNTVKVWDAKTGAEVLTLKGHSNFGYSAAFSPDGWRIATGSHDGTARVWDATPVNREFQPNESRSLRYRVSPQTASQVVARLLPSR